MELMNTAFLKGLGITIFHSIWQATLVALLMSLVLSLIKREKAKERYVVSLGALFLLFITSLSTFWMVYQPSSLSSSVLEEGQLAKLYSDIIIISNESNIHTQIREVIMQNIEWISMLWGVGMLFFAGKIILGLRFTETLRWSSRNVEQSWVSEILNDLKVKAGFSKLVDLRESIKIKSPSVVGLLKPCIYFPIGLVNNLSPEEAEAILAHELAHIIRNDYIINIFQSTIETFYYFHPAVWWISATIRNEREHACDDLAIDIIGNKLRYAKSLLLLQEWEGKRTPGLAMSFSSKTTPLFERMKRILNQPKNKHEMKQKIIASLILITSVVWISATEPENSKVKSDTQSQDFTSALIEKREVEKPLIYQVGTSDTIPKKIKDSKSTIIELKNGKIKRLNIDGVDVPQSELEEHSDYIDELRPENYFRFFHIDSLLVNPEMKDFTFDIESQEQLRQELDRMRFHLDSIRPHLNEEMRELHNFNNEWRFEMEEGLGQLDSVFADMDFAENEFQFHRGNFDTIRFNFDSLRGKMEDLDFYFEDMAGQFRTMMDSIDFPELSANIFERFDSIDFGDFGQGFNFNFDSLRFPEFDADYDFVYGNNLERAFIRELKKDELYDEEGNSIKLSFDDLEINGKKQSDKMLDKYKKIYETKTGIELLEGSSLNIQIDNKAKGQNLRRL